MTSVHHAGAIHAKNATIGSPGQRNRSEADVADLRRKASGSREYARHAPHRVSRGGQVGNIEKRGHVTAY
jgi:hypothetical protein